MKYPDDRKYFKEHTWIKMEGKTGRIGITDYAQDRLGELFFLELPKEGGEIMTGEPFGLVESAKAASDLYSPVSGKVDACNKELEDEPDLINQDPYEKGWMILVKLQDQEELSSLMSAGEYREYVEKDE